MTSLSPLADPFGVGFQRMPRIFRGITPIGTVKAYIDMRRCDIGSPDEAFTRISNDPGDLQTPK